MMWKLLNISYKYHIIFAFILRMILIIYGEFHDKFSEVPYTDIDYKVFTDASRYIWNLKSPYERHTFRYTPILAILLIPNIIFHASFGKVLFSIVDLVVGLLIRTLVIYNRQKYFNHTELRSEIANDIVTKQVTDDSKTIRNRKNVQNCETDTKPFKDNSKPVEENYKNNYDYVPDYSMYFWIYNPMAIAISTRGNSDSVAVFFVLLTLYFLQCKQKYFVAGLVHGLAIHTRLYPIIYSLSFFMYLSKYGQYSMKRVSNTIPQMTLMNKQNLTQFQSSNNENIRILEQRKTIFKKDYFLYLIPNYDQFLLILGCISSLFIFIGLFYYLYGYNFLYETYIYHFIRKDTRHNFSLFFYIQYLTSGVKNIGIWQKVLSVLPQVVLLLVLSVRYGLNKFTLPFSILTQTIVMVAYNSVLTSQYFVWILAILPLTLWQFEMTVRSAIILTIIWFAAQIAWLLPAYLLEFHGQNTFMFIWYQSVSFFCANMAILGRLIKCYVYKNDT